MTDDLEGRLRALLTTKAEQVDPSLDGTRLRAVRRPDRPVPLGHSIAAALITAAAVVVLAVMSGRIADRAGPRPAPPGHGLTSPAAVSPAPSPSPASPSPTSPSPSPTSLSPVPTAPSASPTPVATSPKAPTPTRATSSSTSASS